MELTKLGAFHASLGEMEKAFEFLQQAKRLWQGSNDPRQARTWHGLGDVYAARGERQTAMEYYGQALERWRASGDRYWESITLHSMGRAALASGDWQHALDHFNQSLRLRREIGDRRGQAATLTHLGAAFHSWGHSSGDAQRALGSYRESLALCREIGDREGAAQTLYHLARLARDGGQTDEARARIEEAIQLVEQVRANFMSQEMRAAYLASVRDYYELCIELLMRQDERQSGGGFAAQALQISERARARSLLELLAEAGADIRQGADPQLVARERAVQQHINAIAQRLNLPGNQLAPAQIAALNRQTAALSEEYQQIEAQLRAASPRYAALTQPVPLSAPEIRQLLDEDTLLLEYSLGEERSFLWAVSRANVNSYVLPARAVIEAKAQRVYQLLIARSRQSEREPQEERQQRQQRLKQADAQFVAAASELSQWLLAPVAAHLGNKRLVIVAQGALQFIPFGALPECGVRSADCGLAGQSRSSSNRSAGDRKIRNPQSALRIKQSWQPLIVGHEIVNLPSASVLAQLRRDIAERQRPPKTIAVIADPVFSAADERVRPRSPGIGQADKQPPGDVNRDGRRDAGPNHQRELTRALEDMGYGESGARFSRLKGTGEEAERILSLLPAGQELRALDFKASRATATAPALGQYRYLHFATHAFINSEHPELSGLVLSLVDEAGRKQDGFLLYHEIFNLRLPADLVTLSACQTGLGKDVKGEGIVGLTRGFMYAGASRVLVSLWSVRDRESAQLMTGVYQRLLGPQRLSPAAALRAAQIEMWRKGQAPYYWAAFVLQGEWK